MTVLLLLISPSTILYSYSYWDFHFYSNAWWIQENNNAYHLSTKK